jgi:CheY-like chemotaxis protein
MIIEDERLLRLINTMEFEEEGFTVVALSHGEPALEILASGDQVDLLMTDISLPDSIDGWEIARRARALRPELPVIYVTGYTKSR